MLTRREITTQFKNLSIRSNTSSWNCACSTRFKLHCAGSENVLSTESFRGAGKHPFSFSMTWSCVSELHVHGLTECQFITRQQRPLRVQKVLPRAHWFWISPWYIQNLDLIMYALCTSVIDWLWQPLWQLQGEIRDLHHHSCLKVNACQVSSFTGIPHKSNVI